MKIRMRSIFGYLFGVPILLFGVLALVTSVPGGIALIIAGLIATPRTRRSFQRRTGIELSTGAAGGIPTILVIVGIVALAVAGAGVTSPGDDVENVSVEHQGLTAESPDHDLEVTYNTRAQTSVSPNPDSMTHYDSDSGEKFLVVRLEMENQGESDIDLTPRLFKFEHDGVVHEYQALFGSDGMNDVSLQPGSSYSSWVVFSIPEDATEGTLTADGEAFFDETVAVEFAHDDSMAIEMET